MRLWPSPRLCGVCAAAIAWTTVATARGQGAGTEPQPQPADLDSDLNDVVAPRIPPKAADSVGEIPPHTMFQLSIGLLALPAAEVCEQTTVDCEPGETSLAFSLDNLGRLSDFAFGAGITWAFGLRPGGPAPGDPDGSLGRQHSRSYFLVQGHFRYYPPPLGSFDWWVGSSMGLVVVNDAWSTLADREPYADTDFVGPRAQNLVTEGVSFGSGIGGHITLSDRWMLGTHFRYSNWVLPSDREVTPQQDLASLAGRIDIFDFGIVAGFQLPL